MAEDVFLRYVQALLWWSWMFFWMSKMAFSQPGRDCLRLCSQNITCALECASCDFDCCDSLCSSARVGDVCDPVCYVSSLDVSVCCSGPPPPPPQAFPGIPGPGNCSLVDIPSGNLTMVEGAVFTFNVIAIDSSCSGSTCSCATLFVGDASFIKAAVYNIGTGLPSPKTACTVGNASASGVFPVSCRAENSLADANIQYGVFVQLLSYASWVSPIGFTTPYINIVAGPVSVSACMASWFNSNSTFVAGSEAKLFILQKDAYNNTVGSKTGRNEVYNFQLYVIANPSVNTSISFPSFNVTADLVQGIQIISFYPQVAGKFYLHVGNATHVIQRSPIAFNVLPAALSINDSLAVWPNGVNSFQAGSMASLAILQLDKFANPIAKPELMLDFNFLEDSTKPVINVTMSTLEIDPDYLSANFVPTLAGQYIVHVGNGTQEVPSSPFTFTVVAGPISVQNCSASWLWKSSYYAGERAEFKVTQMDAYGNNVSLATGSLNYYNFIVNVSNADDYRPVSVSSLMLLPAELGSAFRTIVFYPTLAGKFLLSVGSDTANISRSPFAFQVLPGPISVPDCAAIWPNGTQLSAGVPGSLQIYKRDRYNNSVYDNFSFLAEIVSHSDDIPVGSLPDFGIQVQNVNGTDYNTVTFMSTLSGEFEFILGSSTDSIQNSPLGFFVNASSVSTPDCIPSWPKKVSTFPAGSEGRLEILLKDGYNNTVSSATGGYDFGYVLSSSVLDSNLQPLPGYNTIVANDESAGLKIVKFYPKTAGLYSLAAWSSTQNITGSPFPFTVTAGSISVSNCSASWLGGVNVVDAGTQAVIQVLLMDAYGNNVSIATGRNDSYNFVVEVLGHPDSLLAWNVTVVPQNFSGYQSVVFFPTNAGVFKLRIGSKTKNISGSPFTLTVNPGSLSVPASSGQWLDDIEYFIQNTTASFVIFPRDTYGNLISSQGLTGANFTALVYFAANLSMLQVPMVVSQRDNSSLLMVFNMTLVGRFILQVGNASEDIDGSPFVFTVTTDNVEPSRTILGGDGLRNSTAGVLSTFLVQLRDSFGNPAAANLTDLTVEFTRLGAAINITYNITVVPKSSGAFLISYTPLLAGDYKILVKWRDRVLGGGPAIKKTVYPASIFGPWCTTTSPASLNGVAGLTSSFLVTAVDFYNNTSPTGPINISLSFLPPAFETKSVTINKNGTFTVSYNITKAGTYRMTILGGATNATDPIVGSPFLITVSSAPVSISQCKGAFADGNAIGKGRPVRFFVSLKDRFKNSAFQTQSATILQMFNASVYAIDGRGPLNISDLVVQQIATYGYSSDQLLVAFTMHELGNFKLEVGNATTKIANGAPNYFSIVPEAPSLRNSSIWGNGLKDSTAGNTTSVYLTLRDAFGYPVTADPKLILVNLTIADRVTVIADVFSLGGGFYEANYTTTVAGVYTVSISWSEISLATFNKTVFPGPVVPTKCRAMGPGLSGAVAGETVEFNISAYDAYGNPSAASVSFIVLFDPSIDEDSNLTTTWWGNARFHATYYILKARSYNLTLVALTPQAQVRVPGSPFWIKIRPGEPQIISSVVIGEGLSLLASVQKWNELVVYMFDVYENPVPLDITVLVLNVQGPGVSVYQTFKATVGYKYAASYKPSLPGDYQVSVTYKGVQLNGSPFSVTVGTTVETAKDFNAAITPTWISVGEIAMVTISASYVPKESLIFTVDLTTENYIETLIADPTANGSYVAAANVTYSGSLTVVISLYGSLINGSYSLNVEAGAISVPNCVVLDDMDLESTAIAGVPQNITVEGRDRFDNPVLVDGDEQGNLVNFTMILSGTNMQEFLLFYTGSGLFEGSFLADTPGVYDLTIMGDLTEIRGSPFMITVT